MSAQVISFKCILKNKVGLVLGSTFNREVLTASEDTDVRLFGLAKGLQNLKMGERRSVSVSAAEAYGLYEPDKVILYPRKKLPRDIVIGRFISVPLKNGSTRSYKVIQFYDDMVSLDGNHPLAGQDLVFEIETLEVRDATIDEIGDSSNKLSAQNLH